MISGWQRFPISFLGQPLSRQASCWALTTVLLTACSCSTAHKQTARTATDPFLKHDAATQVAANSTEEGVRKGYLTSPAARSGAASPLPQERNDFDVGAIQPSRNPGAYTPGSPGLKNGAIQQTAAENRCPDFCEPCPGRGACSVIDETPCASAKLYPDEYLCDGGDRDYPIHYQDDQMLGLDSEDAAVEYRDDLGNRHVKPSSRVCVYAPRFAAVTSVTEPLEDVGGGRPMQTIAATVGTGLANREGTFAQHQRDATERLVTRARGSGLTNSAAADVVDRPIAIHGHVHTTTPVLDFAFLRTGVLKQSEEARLAESIQSAQVWTRDQNPVVIAKSEQAIELKSEFKELELVGQENRFKGQARLRVVKTADKKIAEPGDIVTFTIRYDNIGDREVHDVVIVDNLTPRLEYVDDSATSDRDGKLEIEDNGEGSLILKWVLEEPLKGRSGGVVTFQAIVR